MCTCLRVRSHPTCSEIDIQVKTYKQETDESEWKRHSKYWISYATLSIESTRKMSWIRLYTNSCSKQVSWFWGTRFYKFYKVLSFSFSLSLSLIHSVVVFALPSRLTRSICVWVVLVVFGSVMYIWSDGECFVVKLILTPCHFFFFRISFPFHVMEQYNFHVCLLIRLNANLTSDKNKKENEALFST